MPAALSHRSGVSGGGAGGETAGVARHVHGRAGNGPAAHAAAHAVAYLAARACSSAVERLDGRREVVGLGFQRDYTLNGLHAEPVACALILGCKLLHNRALRKGNVVLVSRKYLAGILFCGLLNQCKETRLALLAVDNERSAEDFVAAMLGVDLGKAENFRVGKRAAVCFLDLVQVFYFFRTQGQTLLLVELLQVVHVPDGLRFMVHREDVLVQTAVHALEHRVVVGRLTLHRKELFYTQNAIETHVLGYLNGIRTPWSDHLATRSNKEAFQLLGPQWLGIAIEPAQFFCLLLTGPMVHFSGNDVLLGSLKEKNHNLPV